MNDFGNHNIFALASQVVLPILLDGFCINYLEVRS